MLLDGVVFYGGAAELNTLVKSSVCLAQDYQDNESDLRMGTCSL